MFFSLNNFFKYLKYFLKFVFPSQMVNCAAGQMSKATKTLSDRQDTQDFNELWPQDCRNLSTMIFINLICVANP